jgi:hypothetical protein
MASPSAGADLFAIFDELFPDVSDVTHGDEPGDKMLTDMKFFKFGGTDEFRKGLDVQDGLLHSMLDEFQRNEGGMYLGEYLYVVNKKAIAVPNVDSDDEKRKAADKAYKDIHESLEAKRRRDEIYHDWVLNDFWLTEPAQEAKLTKAEVAALRLYTGPAYKPINAALRQQNVEPWATTIACCYTAVRCCPSIASSPLIPSPLTLSYLRSHITRPSHPITPSPHRPSYFTRWRVAQQQQQQTTYNIQHTTYNNNMPSHPIPSHLISHLRCSSSHSSPRRSVSTAASRSLKASSCTRSSSTRSRAALRAAPSTRHRIQLDADSLST